MASPSTNPLLQDNSPFALTRAMVSGREQIVFRHGAKCLPDIYRKASRTGHLPLLITDEATITVQDLFGMAGAYARLFASRNIGPGSRVALVLKGDADWIAAFVAVTSLGATAVLTGDVDPARQAAAAGCNIAVTDHASLTGWNDIIWTSERSAVGQQPASPGWFSIDPEREACIAFTSGSSSDPKGVILTHRGIATGLMNTMFAGASAAKRAPIARTRTGPTIPVTLLRTPLHHVSGYMQLLLMMLTGGSVVRSEQTDICSLVARRRITSITGVSDEEIAMLLDAGSEAASWPLRSIAVAGRDLPVGLRRAVRDRLPELGLGAGYGLTETNGLVCAIGNAELDMRPQAVGPLLPTVECRITRRNGQDCEIGESGDIRLRGAMLMRGYCQSEVLEDGWFVTGDIGYFSDDGYLHLLDRDDRFLHDGDRHISCREIEEAVRAITGLCDVAAIALHEDAGERLVIAAAIGAHELACLRPILARQFPSPIIERAKFVATDRLPRTSSGKIAYARLLEDIQL